MTAPTIQVRNLRKTYRDGLVFRRRVEALAGVTFDVHPGEIFGLLGPNGAGKTTVIKVLLGIVRKTSGDAHLLGREAGDRNARRHVGYLPEHHRIPRHLTGAKALEYYGELSGLALGDIRRRSDDLLRRVGLGDWGGVSVRKYSKGMQQRLGLAQALLHDPQLLILDEPTDGVDPVGRAEIRSLLKDLKTAGKTILVNSHLLQEIELICDRVAILDRGRVQRVGSVSELTQHGSGVAGRATDGSPSSSNMAPAGRTAWEVIFVIAGPPPALAALSQEFPIESLNGSEPSPGAAGSGFRVRLQAGDQADVDRAVDRIRTLGISIVSMAPHRRTLEEAFIQIVGEAQHSG